MSGGILHHVIRWNVKNIRPTDHPVDCPVNVSLFFKGLIPGIARFVGRGPWPAGYRFDGLNGDMPPFTEPQHRIEILTIALVPVHDIVIGEQNRIKVEPLQTAQ